MNGMLPQLLLGAGNLAIGFGAGWVFKGVRGFCSRSRQDSVCDSHAVSKKILTILDEIESATTEESLCCTSLRKLLVFSDDVTSLDSVIHVHSLYGRLLQSQQEHLVELDPDCNIISQEFVQQILVSRLNVDGLTGRLRGLSTRPAGFDSATLLERLEELERANIFLLDELAMTRSQILPKTVDSKRVETAALEDLLTKLPNRRAFDQQLQKLNAAFNHSGIKFSLILINLDEFEQINDQYGRDAGDAALTVAASLLRNTCRSTDHVSRIGGDEFAVLISDSTLEGAIVLAERIRNRMESAGVKHQSKQIHFTCSLGVVHCEDGCSGQQMMRVADELLYAAKCAGRNTVRSFVEFPDSFSEFAAGVESEAETVRSVTGTRATANSL